jgi:homotetrameric cytidine deaminase
MDRNDPLVRELVNKARAAREHAYAPYSGFAVGAALVNQAGEIFTGCNVENVSFGATICAERNAVTTAVAHAGRPALQAIAVVTADEPPAVPCALCLQVLAEFCSPRFPIILAGESGKVDRVLQLRELLPQPFTSFSH